MIALSLKLLLAHLIGDFLLQPTKWVEDKEKRMHASPYLYYHILIHLLTTVILLQFNPVYWCGVLLITGSHLGIDLLKLRLKSVVDHRVLFFADQLAHLFVIAIVVHYYIPYYIDFEILYAPGLLLFLICVLLTTVVSSILMKVMISKWNLSTEYEGESLHNAGLYIGILERLFVFVFIIMKHWEGIGFLLAAKSVFRFGDLSNAKDRKLTEYILIGTFISFGLALLFGFGYNYFSDLISGK